MMCNSVVTRFAGVNKSTAGTVTGVDNGFRTHMCPHLPLDASGTAVGHSYDLPLRALGVAWELRNTSNTPPAAVIPSGERGTVGRWLGAR